MNQELEEELWRAVPLSGCSRDGKTIREVIAEMVSSGKIAHEKQAIRTLDKWECLGWIDWGTSIFGSWRLIEDRPAPGQRIDRNQAYRDLDKRRANRA